MYFVERIRVFIVKVKGGRSSEKRGGVLGFGSGGGGECRGVGERVLI